ncbi:hypothetical protein ElyMa_001086100 [Elysia marginata]|uniref:Secreted protein n=1 Tax=Elysia marginata TaxID=1093978 RepID=A0AAV4HTW6_9GAST|nr:hypothetical protein ElyMa_001086100 [Elysia marginata]
MVVVLLLVVEVVVVVVAVAAAEASAVIVVVVVVEVLCRFGWSLTAILAQNKINTTAGTSRAVADPNPKLTLSRIFADNFPP